MANATYKKQVALLLDVLPEVAKETCFALHGGTAINLFVRNMPRLSADIDLTYTKVEDRLASFDNIATALERIKTNIRKVIPDASALHKVGIGKLLISARGVDVKLEVNLTNRGLINEPVKMTLCDKTQSEFKAFCAINVVPPGQLFGGKIVAALDRQHPRDLFDVKYLLENEGFSEPIKTGFLFFLLSGARPMNEILSPHFQDQRQAMENQFSGMSEEDFSYEEYEKARLRLVKTIQGSLTKEDKEFLLSIKNLTPDWSIYNFEHFPAIVWKLQNLKKLKETNPLKHNGQYEALEKVLGRI